MKDIYFKCRACGKSLVVDRSAAGYSAECPGCRTSVVVPHRSSIPPKVWRWIGLVAANLLLVAALTAAGVYVIVRAYRSGLPPAPSIPVAIATSPAQAEPADASERALDPELVARERELEQKNQELASSYNSLQSKYDNLGNWVVQNVQGKFPMPERLVGKLRVTPVTQDYKVNPDLVELLRINGSEEAKINDAFQYTRGTLSQIEAKLIQVTEATADKVTLYVPSFEKEGQQVKEDLFYALESTLGGPRADRLHDVTDAEMETSFDHFGTASRTLVFEVAYPPDATETPYLVIKDGWILPDGASARSINVKESAVREIPKDYQNYVSLLPENIAAYVVK